MYFLFSWFHLHLKLSALAAGPCRVNPPLRRVNEMS